MYFRQAYCMSYQSFKHLAVLLHLRIFAACSKRGLPRYYCNGQISPDVWLACAIQWFAGGSPYDITATCRISHTDTINSFWFVVDAINKHPAFAIVYPTDHNNQPSIAAGFSEVSSAGFPCRAGAVDGIVGYISLHQETTLILDVAGVIFLWKAEEVWIELPCHLQWCPGQNFGYIYPFVRDWCRIALLLKEYHCSINKSGAY